MIHKDFIIIDQGLAGSLLALELLNRGKSVVVISAQIKPAASNIAAVKNIFCFNGLGSKGVMLAPNLVKRIADYLINNKNKLPRETEVNRFFTP